MKRDLPSNQARKSKSHFHCETNASQPSSTSNNQYNRCSIMFLCVSAWEIIQHWWMLTFRFAQNMYICFNLRILLFCMDDKSQMKWLFRIYVPTWWQGVLGSSEGWGENETRGTAGPVMGHVIGNIISQKCLHQKVWDLWSQLTETLFTIRIDVCGC